MIDREREREKERERERERERKRHTERKRERERGRDKEKEGGRERKNCSTHTLPNRLLKIPGFAEYDKFIESNKAESEPVMAADRMKKLRQFKVSEGG